MALQMKKETTETRTGRGRPRQDARKERVFQIRLTPHRFHKLHAQAEERGVPAAELVRRRVFDEEEAAED
jgi:hypothetical protein